MLYLLSKAMRGRIERAPNGVMVPVVDVVNLEGALNRLGANEGSKQKQRNNEFRGHSVIIIIACRRIGLVQQKINERYCWIPP